MNELEKFRQKAHQRKVVSLARRRELYRYARELDFSYDEARHLSGTSKGKIDRLTKLKFLGKSPPP